MVHFKAFPCQQDTQTAISKPTSFIRQLAQPLAQGIIALVPLLVLEDRPMQVGQFTRPPLGSMLCMRLPGNGRSDKPCRSITSDTALRFTCSTIVLGPMADKVSPLVVMGWSTPHPDAKVGTIELKED